MQLNMQDLIDDCRDRQLRWDGLALDVMTAQQRAVFVRNMTLAGIVELTELMGTMRWKSWAMEQGEMLDDRPTQLAEAADVLFFLGNIFAAFGFTSEELEVALLTKRRVIEGRHESAQYLG